MNHYLIKIKVEYRGEERIIQQTYWETCEVMVLYNCVKNLLEVFKDDDSAFIYEDGCVIQKIGQLK